MNFSPMLRTCSPATVLIAIRSAINEPPAPRPTRAQSDPWYGGDPTYRTAWAGVYPVVPL